VTCPNGNSFFVRRFIYRYDLARRSATLRRTCRFIEAFRLHQDSVISVAATCTLASSSACNCKICVARHRCKRSLLEAYCDLQIAAPAARRPRQHKKDINHAEEVRHRIWMTSSAGSMPASHTRAPANCARTTSPACSNWKTWQREKKSSFTSTNPKEGWDVKNAWHHHPLVRREVGHPDRADLHRARMCSAQRPATKI